MRRRVLALGLGMLAGIGAVSAQNPPELAEVLGLVRTHLSGLTAEQLNSAAVESLIAQLGSRARLLEAYEEPETPAEPIADSEVFDGRFAYVRLGKITGDVAPKLATTLAEFARTNTLQGCVLDLRFADGRDFGAAAHVAGLFVPEGKPVLDWGEGVFLAETNTNLFTQPVVALVNGQTRGAAEAVVAALRAAGVAVVIGKPTAGEASVYREFALTSGQRLRLATASVRTGDGETIAATGLQPDIAVKINPDVERAYLQDPFTVIHSRTNSPSGTNSITTSIRVRRKVTEAELVREHARAPAIEPVPAQSELPPRIVYDPALARALDLLKGLTLMQAK
jgi:hypothetical protein